VTNGNRLDSEPRRPRAGRSGNRSDSRADKAAQPERELPSVGHPFDALTPELIMAAVESCGPVCDGRLLALNSYENRVYQVGLEEAQPLIAKFYRPQRWSREQILEEHQFCFELEQQELPVVPPLRDAAGNSLQTYGEFYFALYPRRGGHAPELDNLDHLYSLGQLLGRMHAVGAVRPFQQRPALEVHSFGHDSVSFIGAHFIPPDLEAVYAGVTEDILKTLAAVMAPVRPDQRIRVHGDCHAGNMLWRDGSAHFVDFDDSRMAPAVQDIWMLLSGDRQRQLRQLAEIIDGYSEFYDFQPWQLRLIEGLRTLRIMHFSAWLARRWHDPAFPRAFPWFNTPRYWGDHILELREQQAALQEPPLQLR